MSRKRDAHLFRALVHFLISVDVAVDKRQYMIGYPVPSSLAIIL